MRADVERAELEHEGHVAPVDLAELEEEVRRGRLPATARLRHRAWTGGDFRPLHQVDALADALQAPEARFVAWIGRVRAPWTAIALALAVALAGFVQGLADLRILRAAALSTALDLAPVGFDELVLAGRWWTPLTSQLVHSGPMHLLPNLGVVAYMGYRVERALGPASLLLVAASAMASGTLAISLLETLPAVGSSVLGFGLWGAVLAIGFRWGDTLSHLRIRGRYGFGSLPVFALLFAASLFNPGATHVGHLFGLLGGFGAAMVAPTEATVPRRRLPRAIAANLLLATLICALPMLGGPLLGRAPAALAWPAERVEVEQAGVVLSLPWRMARNELRLAGMQGWRTSPNSDAALYVDLAGLRDGAEPGAALTARWEAVLGEALQAVEPGPVPAGWQGYAWERVDPATGAVLDRVEERLLVRGSTVLRVGWRRGATDSPARAALFRAVLDTVEVGDPPGVEEARQRLERNPASPRMQYELARELARLADRGQAHEADDLLGALSDRADAWAWDAARLRLRLWERASAAEGPAFRGGGAELAEAQRWVLGWLARAPPLDDEIHRPGVAILVHTGACAEARAHAEALVERGEASRPLGEELLATVTAGCR